MLDEYGYAPQAVGDELMLRNCPYEPLADHDRELVCGLNLALIDGIVAGIGLRRSRCELDEPAGGCCVRVRPWPTAREPTRE